MSDLSAASSVHGEDVAVDLGTEVIHEDPETSEDELRRAAAEVHDPSSAHSGVETKDEESAQSQGEQAAPEDIADLKKRQWAGTGAINTKWFGAIGRELSVDRLAWDLKLQHGQSRLVDDTHVEQLVNSLTIRPPREPIKVSVWENDVDKKFYIMSGQHLARAVQRIREDREKNGLKLEHWHRFVRADVMKYRTPVDIRRTLAGAENASTKVMRVTTVSECLRNFLHDTSRNSLSDKILNAVEQSGLNVVDSSPVCNLCFCSHASCVSPTVSCPFL